MIITLRFWEGTLGFEGDVWIQMTLEGSFSKEGMAGSLRPMLPRRRGSVPLLVTEDTSGQPLVTSNSTRPLVVATLISAGILFAAWNFDAAKLAAARAYVRQVRPSWSTSFTLALFCRKIETIISLFYVWTYVSSSENITRNNKPYLSLH